MKLIVLNLIKNLFRLVGLEVSRVKKYSDIHYVMSYHANKNCDVVLDIGANIGQYGQSLINSGLTKKLISFEPIKDAHSNLCKNAESIKNWTIYKRCAVGVKPGTFSFNISKNSVSSSLLKMKDSHIVNAPSSTIVEVDEVEVVAMNNIIEELLDLNANTKIGIKLDVQGMELELLEVLSPYFANIPIIALELSFVELYEKQKLFPEVYEFMLKNHYHIIAVENGFTSLSDRSSLQADFVFYKNEERIICKN